MGQNGKPRLLLMGCGAVGGVIAGGLLRTGHDLTIVTHNGGIAGAINAGGLQVTTPRASWNVPAVAYTRLEEVEGKFDAVYLTMKATAVEQAAREVVARLSPEGYAVTLQNGVVEDRVAGILGGERLVGALVGWGATMHAPGIYEMTSMGKLVVGELDGRITPRVEQLKLVLDGIAPTSVSANIYGVLWSKLAINCATSVLGALSGQRLGEMLRRGKLRRLGLAIISEVLDVAQGSGITVEPVGGTLDLNQLYLPPGRRAGDLGLDLVPKHAVLLLVGLKFRKLKSSMLQSLERGRRPEIDFLNGYVVDKGREVAVPTPANEALTAMVREVEAGTRPITPDNLAELTAKLLHA